MKTVQIASLQELIARWERVYEAFTSPFYSVEKELDAISTLRQCIDELRSEIFGETEARCETCGCFPDGDYCGTRAKMRQKSESRNPIKSIL